MTRERTMSNVESHLQSFRSLEPSTVPFVARLREAALARFADLGFPSTRLEDWKYTDVTPLARQIFRLSPPGSPGATARAAVERERLGNGSLLVFRDGHPVAELSNDARLPAGAIVTSLASALVSHPHLVEPHLGRLAPYEAEGSSFTALNTAFIRDGAFVYLPRGAVLDEPIHLLFLAGATSEPTVIHPRVLIVAEENSRARVVEEYVGPDASTYWTNAVTEIALGANAAVEHCRVQREGEAAHHVGTVAAEQGAGSNFVSRVFSLGGSLVRSEVATALAAPGGECTLDGLYLTDGRQHADHHTSIDHREPRCTSRELYKGILAGQSTAVFNGKVFVRENAQKSDAQQMNKNLLLSEDAVVDTKPQLEIFADDVKCSHGATIGQLDDEAVFYLRARGIEAESARRLLIQAFANELVTRVGVEPLRTRLEQAISARFGGQG
jgi:Fe-S cluster assembly protein SufD